MTLPFDVFIGSQNMKNVKGLNLSFGSNEHGDDQLSYTQAVGSLPGLRTPVKLRDPDYGWFWSGYTWQPRLELWDCSGYNCRGWQYSADDNSWNEPKIFRKQTPVITMVTEALAKCSHIFDASPTMIADLSVQLDEDTQNFGLGSPKDVLDFVEQISNYMTTPFKWYVRQDRNKPFTESPTLYIAGADPQPRYMVKLTKGKDDFKPIYDSDIINQVVMLTWGNDQYITASNSGYYSNTPLPPSVGVPNTLIPQPIDYTYIPDMRVKRVRADNTVKTYDAAVALAEYLVERNRQLRPIGFQITLDCDTLVRAVPPAAPAQISNWPHHLMQPHFAIRILNDLSAWGQFGYIDTFYIIGVKWTEDNKVVLTVGDPVQRDAFRMLSRFDGNKLGTVIGSGVMNVNEHDTNGYPIFGPFFDAQGEYKDNGIEAGIGLFANASSPTSGNALFDDPNEQFQLPHGAAHHPELVADYGTQANFGREADSVGIKGFVGVTPMKALKWDIEFLPAPGSDTIPSANLSIEFYADYPFTPGAPFATKSIAGATGARGSFTGAEQQTFPQGGRVGIRVSATTAPSGSGFIVFVGGKKLYPDLGITT